MDFWKKYFTKTSDTDDTSTTGDSADTAVSCLTRTTSKIMISQDNGGDEESVERLSSRKRPISSVDYGKSDGQYSSYSSSSQPTTTTTTTTSRVPVQSLTPMPSTHLSTVPKPIPRPRLPPYPILLSPSLSHLMSFSLSSITTPISSPLLFCFSSLFHHALMVLLSNPSLSQLLLSHLLFFFVFTSTAPRAIHAWLVPTTICI